MSITNIIGKEEYIIRVNQCYIRYLPTVEMGYLCLHYDCGGALSMWLVSNPFHATRWAELPAAENMISTIVENGSARDYLYPDWLTPKGFANPNSMIRSGLFSIGLEYHPIEQINVKRLEVVSLVVP